MLDQRIQQQLYDSADQLVHGADGLAPAIASACELAVATLTSGGKLLIAGTGFAWVDGQYVAALLAGMGERERPGLPALALGGDGPMLSVLGHVAGSTTAGLVRQLQALGLPGDLLVLIDGIDAPMAASATAPSPLGPLIDAAHGRDMSVLLWEGGLREAAEEPSAARAPLNLIDTDVRVPVRADRASHRREMLRAALHAWADAIDHQLLGEQDL